MRFTWARKKAPGSLPPPFYPARKAGSISCRRRRPARQCWWRKESLLCFRFDHIGNRVHGLTGDADFVVEVRAGRAAGRTDIADDVTLLHAGAGLHRNARHMCTPRLQIGAMFDRDELAVAREPFRLADIAIGGGIDRRASGRQIDTLVAAATAEHGVRPHAVIVSRVSSKVSGTRDPRRRRRRAVEFVPFGEQLWNKAVTRLGRLGHLLISMAPTAAAALAPRAARRAARPKPAIIAALRAGDHATVHPIAARFRRRQRPAACHFYVTAGTPGVS